MKTKVAIIVLVTILVLASSVGLFAEHISSADSNRVGMGELIIPLSDPLLDFESNGLAWWSITNLIIEGHRYIDNNLQLKNSRLGRSVNILFALYYSRATGYYSHEIAHDFFSTRRGFARLKVDWSDWSHLVPAYVQSNLLEFWDEEELLEYLDGDKATRLKWNKKIALIYESGFYQQRLNAIRVGRYFDLSRKIDAITSIAYLINQFEDYSYILAGGNKEILTISDPSGYLLEDSNDVIGYIQMMDELNIRISLDDWLVASFLSDILSVHTFNSLISLTRYILYGDESVEPIKIRPGDNVALSPPNFYLFPSVRGLFLETETFMDFGGKGCFLSFGSGLDAFGARATGPVDRIRVGGKYHSFSLGSSFAQVTFSPYLYVNFTNKLKHVGQSIGMETNLLRWRRFSLYGKFEYNMDDMVEQVIKYKDNGFYFISGIIVDM